MNKSDINCWFEKQSITVIKMMALSESPVLLPRTMENTLDKVVDPTTCKLEYRYRSLIISM